jgi:hypothetical protein
MKESSNEYRMAILAKIVEEFDRITTMGIKSKNTYSMRNEFFSELEQFKRTYQIDINRAVGVQEEVMVDAGTQLSFDDHLEQLHLEQKFRDIWETMHPETMFNELGEDGQERLSAVALSIFKQGFYETLE